MKSQELRKPLPSYTTSLFIDTVLMTFMTVGLVVLFAIEENILELFARNNYVVSIYISVVSILILLLIFFERIRSNFYGVHVILWIIVILWSMVFAAVIQTVQWKCALISLAVTILTTVLVVVVTLKLPSLSERG
ncbi:unnamed protein product, partial [Trichobilharzia szidati]